MENPPLSRSISQIPGFPARFDPLFPGNMSDFGFSPPFQPNVARFQSQISCHIHKYFCDNFPLNSYKEFQNFSKISLRIQKFLKYIFGGIREGLPDIFGIVCIPDRPCLGNRLVFHRHRKSGNDTRRTPEFYNFHLREKFLKMRKFGF